MIGEFGLTFRSSPDGLLRLLGDLGKPGTVVVQTAGLHNGLHKQCLPMAYERPVSSLQVEISKYVGRFGRGALEAYGGLQELRVSGRRGTSCDDAAEGFT